MKHIEWIEKYMADAERMICENQLEQGLKVLDGLLYEEPGYGKLHNHLGWAYMYYTSDFSKAEMHFKLAIKFDETFAPPYLHLGVLYNRLGKYTDAIVWLQSGLSKANANRFTLMQHIGQAYELRGELSKAIKTYKESMVASVIDHEVSVMMQNIKRCRRKRIASLFLL